MGVARPVRLTGCIAALLLLLGATGRADADFVTVEDFDSGSLSAYRVVQGSPGAFAASFAAHDGPFGLALRPPIISGGWILRDDAQVTVGQGDVISVWVQLQGGFLPVAQFGFGATEAGTLDVALLSTDNTFDLVESAGYIVHRTLSSAHQVYEPGKWYRVEVDWEVGGLITASLFDSDGTTLLNAVSAASNDFTSGGLAFRAAGPGASVFFDTVQVEYGAVPEPSSFALLGAGALALLGYRWRRRAPGESARQR